MFWYPVLTKALQVQPRMESDFTEVAPERHLEICMALALMVVWSCGDACSAVGSHGFVLIHSVVSTAYCLTRRVCRGCDCTLDCQPRFASSVEVHSETTTSSTEAVHLIADVVGLSTIRYAVTFGGRSATAWPRRKASLSAFAIEISVHWPPLESLQTTPLYLSQDAPSGRMCSRRRVSMIPLSFLYYI